MEFEIILTKKYLIFNEFIYLFLMRIPYLYIALPELCQYRVLRVFNNFETQSWRRLYLKFGQKSR